MFVIIVLRKYMCHHLEKDGVFFFFFFGGKDGDIYIENQMEIYMCV